MHVSVVRGARPPCSHAAQAWCRDEAPMHSNVPFFRRLPVNKVTRRGHVSNRLHERRASLATDAPSTGVGREQPAKQLVDELLERIKNPGKAFSSHIFLAAMWVKPADTLP